MKDKLVIALVTLGTGLAFAVMAFVLLVPGTPLAAQTAVGVGGQASSTAGSQPDTSSPNWKFLSEDVGIMIRNDDRLGLRARLFVRRNGVWLPVAIDGPADSRGPIPLR